MSSLHGAERKLHACLCATYPYCRIDASSHLPLAERFTRHTPKREDFSADISGNHHIQAGLQHLILSLAIRIAGVCTLPITNSAAARDTGPPDQPTGDCVLPANIQLIRRLFDLLCASIAHQRPQINIRVQVPQALLRLQRTHMCQLDNRVRKPAWIDGFLTSEGVLV